MRGSKEDRQQEEDKGQGVNGKIQWTERTKRDEVKGEEMEGKEQRTEDKGQGTDDNNERIEDKGYGMIDKGKRSEDKEEKGGWQKKHGSKVQKTEKKELTVEWRAKKRRTCDSVWKIEEGNTKDKECRTKDQGQGKRKLNRGLKTKNKKDINGGQRTGLDGIYEAHAVCAASQAATASAC